MMEKLGYVIGYAVGVVIGGLIFRDINTGLFCFIVLTFGLYTPEITGAFKNKSKTYR